MTQTIRQRQPRLDFNFDPLAVDFKFHWHARYAAAARNARSTMTPTSALR
jgi:hypothetical protein